jgi:hypothetical protein
MKTEKLLDRPISRRALVRRAAYIAPAILTLQAAPQFAKAGSDKIKIKYATDDDIKVKIKIKNGEVTKEKP